MIPPSFKALNLNHQVDKLCVKENSFTTCKARFYFTQVFLYMRKKTITTYK